MTFPVSPDPIPADARARILADLARLQAEHGVRVLFAVESGSRAWGFPSPDSDFDARFVYVRPLADYLRLFPVRDVIEQPIEGLYDVNGWDIRKALQLLLKPNPVLLEWLSSPIRYLWDEALCAQLTAFANRTAYAQACVHHYLGVGTRLRAEYLDGRTDVNLKKYFYVVRPALCLGWVRERLPGAPPMALSALMEPLPLPAGFREAIAQLLVRKAAASEVGTGARIDVLDAYVAEQFAWAAEQPRLAVEDRPELVEEADAVFRGILGVG